MSTNPFNRYSFAEFGFQNGLKLAYFTANFDPIPVKSCLFLKPNLAKLVGYAKFLGQC